MEKTQILILPSEPTNVNIPSVMSPLLEEIKEPFIYKHKKRKPNTGLRLGSYKSKR